MSKRLIHVSRVGKKGVIVIPKAMRERIGICDGSLVIIECGDGEIIIRPLKVTRVKFTNKIRDLADNLLSEEYVLEEMKFNELLNR